MASKKKLPRSRRCKSTDLLSAQCYCVSDDIDHVTESCESPCCVGQDAKDFAGDVRYEQLDRISASAPRHSATHSRSSKVKDTRRNERPVFGYIDVFIGLSSICFFFFDVVTDILLARDYYYQGRMWPFGLTAGFIIVPCLVTAVLNLRWYFLDYESQQLLVKQHGSDKVKQTGYGLWFLRMLMTALMMGPVIRYIFSIPNITIKVYSWNSIRGVFVSESKQPHSACFKNLWVYYGCIF